ncbi:uncharacterized protein LOC110943913 [Helianthus annuus]|uniref:uncharacterized protein LOC110943913 n=1 Tax=Helianthus annuus TaxID=4232 RepID=UPI000B8F2314|nr:uncharacterized protein LOC110943913 [Helianthus annuus]
MVGVRKNIGEIAKEFMKNNININTSFRSKVGMGDKTLFWVDIWLGDAPLKDQFPCLYQLSTHKKAKVQEMYKIANGGILWDWLWIRVPYSSDSEKQEMDSLKDRLQEIIIENKGDMWVWRYNEDEEFSVKMVPSAVALRNKGMNIQDVMCKICGECEETTSHILLRCNFAKRVWNEVAKWTKTPMVNTEGNLSDILQAFLDSQRSRNVKKILHAIAVQSMWKLWLNRNDRIFAGRN